MLFIELFIALILGSLFGILCGLIPGLHTNTVAALTFSLAPFLMQRYSILTIIVFITSIGVCQETVNCVPATFLGAPDTDTALSVLPAHEMLMKGKGVEAVAINTAGSLFALFSSLLFALPFIYLAKIVYPLVKPVIGYLILIVSVILILKSGKRIWSFLIFIISGMLGLIVLNRVMVSEPLLPLFSGLFGTSLLLFSIKTVSKVPKQQCSKIKFSKGYMKCLVIVSIAGWLCAFLPGLGPAQAAALTNTFFKFDRKRFIFIVGGLSSANFIISFTTLYAVNKARNGAVVIISRLMPMLNMKSLMIIFASCMIVGGFAAIVTLIMARNVSGLFAKVNYKHLCYAVIVFIITLVILMDGFIGLLILLTSTFIGLLANIKGVRKSTMMGCLLLPVMLYFLV